MTSEPLIQIRPDVLATVHSHAAFKFKPGMFFAFHFLVDSHLIPIPTCLGSSDLDKGFLTFKFHKSASDWDENVYMGIVRKLVDAVIVKDGKSILECVPFFLQLPHRLTL